MISARNVNDALQKAANYVLKNGKKVCPRGYETLEVLSLQIKIDNPLDCIPTFASRNINFKFLATEILWILSGSDDPWIIKYLSNLKRYTNTIDGKEVLAGAYGPRIRFRFGVDQIQYVINTLKKDRDSRQAIINIQDPSRDCFEYKDFPCTENFHFFLRDDRLDMITNMRSNDWWLGSFYDLFNFCVIQWIVSSILNVKIGTYFHHVGSYHIYQPNLSMAEEIAKNTNATVVLPPFLSPNSWENTGLKKYENLSQVYDDAEDPEFGDVSNRYLGHLRQYVKKISPLTKSVV